MGAFGLDKEDIKDSFPHFSFWVQEGFLPGGRVAGFLGTLLLCSQNPQITGCLSGFQDSHRDCNYFFKQKIKVLLRMCLGKKTPKYKFT